MMSGPRIWLKGVQSIDILLGYWALRARVDGPYASQPYMAAICSLLFCTEDAEEDSPCQACHLAAEIVASLLTPSYESAMSEALVSPAWILGTLAYTRR